MKNKKIVVEQICRQLCIDQGIDPNDQICKMMPQLLNYPFMAGYFLPDKSYIMPAWQMYQDLVKTTVDIINVKFRE